MEDDEYEYDNVIPSKKPIRQPSNVDFSRIPSLTPITSPSVLSLPTPPTTFPPPPSSSSSSAIASAGLPQELGKCIAHDVALLNKLGWKRFVAARRPRKDLADMHINHPAKRLLSNYRNQGVPAKVTTPPWSPERIRQAIARGPHRSCREHTAFLAEEFVSMIQKGQWTILPFSAVKDFINLRISPPGVVPQRDRRPRWIVDYSKR